MLSTWHTLPYSHSCRSLMATLHLAAGLAVSQLGFLCSVVTHSPGLTHKCRAYPSHATALRRDSLRCGQLWGTYQCHLANISFKADHTHEQSRWGSTFHTPWSHCKCHAQHKLGGSYSVLNRVPPFVETLTPNVAIFGDRIFKKAVKAT